MLKRGGLVLALAVCGLHSGFAEKIELKDKAAITGKILAEKPDQVAVDVGYTILLVPRKDIVSITGQEPAETTAAKPSGNSKPASAEQAAPAPEVNRFYYGAGPSTGSHSVRDLVSQIGEAVVQVRTPSGLGSGFIINEDGFLITNFHVIEGETEISVEVYHREDGQLNRKTYKNVRIIAINKFADLALLRIEDKGAPKFKHVVLGGTDALSVGERVFAIGSPLGLERTVTEGILSTKTRELSGELYLQTTAQINPGNSGGPLFDLNGDVIGVTNMKIIYGEGLGFAIPVEAVKYFLNHRDAFAYSNDNPSSAYRYLEPPSRARKPKVVD